MTSLIGYSGDNPVARENAEKNVEIGEKAISILNNCNMKIAEVAALRGGEYGGLMREWC